jgi:hypothetical protein
VVVSWGFVDMGFLSDTLPVWHREQESLPFYTVECLNRPNAR